MHDPLRLLSAICFRLPILVVGLFTHIRSSGALAGPPGTAELLSYIGLAIIVLLTIILWPLLRRDAFARFFAVSTLLALIPSCATYPHDRMLMWSGIGAMGLIARFLTAAFGSDAGLLPVSLAYRWLWRVVAIGAIIVHLIVSPISKPRVIADWKDRISSMYIPPQDDPALKGQSVLLVNGPLAIVSSHFQVMQAAQGLPIPKHVRILAPSFAPMELKRPDEKTLILRPAGGYIAQPFDRLYCSRERILPVGHVVELSDVSIEILSQTADGRPASIACHFEVPLEDPSLRWLTWQTGGYQSWTPLEVGSSEALPPAIP